MFVYLQLALLALFSYSAIVKASSKTPLYSMCHPAQISTCGRNAECVTVAGCQMGVCRCSEQRDKKLYATSNGIDCETTLAIGDICARGDGSVLPPWAECNKEGRVSCEPRLQAQGRYACVAPATWVSIAGEKCNVNGPNDCNRLIGLTCSRTTRSCICIPGTLWDGKVCQRRISEECQLHEDCKFSYGDKAVCIHNHRCVCAAGSMPVLYAQISNANHRKFFINNYCAPENDQFNGLDQDCMLPGFPTGPKVFCGNNLVCHHCPEFGPETGRGHCLNLTSPRYAEDRLKIYKSATVEGICTANSLPLFN